MTYNVDQQSRFTLFDKWGVLILSEMAAMQHYPEPGCVLIRIKAEYFAPISQTYLYDDEIQVSFDDIDQPSIYDKLMDDSDAKKIVHFMVKHKDKKLVVHCQAGISRSSATACAWAYLHGKPELEEEIRNNSCFYPNAHVYRLLVDEIEARREQATID